MNSIKNPLICAVDKNDISEAYSLCCDVKNYVGMVKLGLEFFVRNGPQGIEKISKTGIPIFLDLKFHDIPNTVAQAVKSAVSLNVDMLTVHTLGGLDMLEAARLAAEDISQEQGVKRPMIVGVTVLTSLDEDDIHGIGVSRTVIEQVELLAMLAKQAHLDGIVCSPHEVAMVKKVCGSDFKTIVPGIRLDGGEKQDQKRTMTPKQALEVGADYLVIGRPITKSDNPERAARELAEQITD